MSEDVEKFLGTLASAFREERKQVTSLTKLFLNIEKMLIDYRLGQLEDTKTEDGDSVPPLFDFPRYADLVKNGYSKQGDGNLSDIAPERVQEVVTNPVVDEDEEETAEEVTEVEQEKCSCGCKKNRVKGRVEKGGTVFKEHETLNLNTTCWDTEGNSVEIDEEEPVVSTSEVMSVALS